MTDRTVTIPEDKRETEREDHVTPIAHATCLRLTEELGLPVCARILIGPHVVCRRCELITEALRRAHLFGWESCERELSPVKHL